MIRSGSPLAHRRSIRGHYVAVLAWVVLATAGSIPAYAGNAAERPSRPATSSSSAPPIRMGPAAIHPTSYIPIAQIPTEDVDFVPAAVANPAYPEMGVWPVEGVLHFFDMTPFPPTLISSIATSSANISGVDFITNGTWGLFQTLGFGYVYTMNGPGALPALTATVALPGAVPNRRDIDPFMFPDPASASGLSALFTSGMAVHCRSIPAGGVRWDVPLPGPIVEAVDPVYSPSGKIFVPCEGFMVVIDAATGAVLSTTALPASLVREVDVKLTGPSVGGPGPPYAWLPTATTLMVFDDTPGSLGASVAALPTVSPLIEGNDMEIDPSGGIGYLPTLAFMHQINLFAPAIGTSYPLAGFVHQRNQDVVFTPPTCGCGPKWAYAMQGIVLIGDNLFGAPAPTVLASPGTLVDGVDPSFSDTAPFGAIFSVPTLSSTNVYNATTVTLLASIPRTAGSGALRVDVDHKPGPMAGNYVAQPTIGGLLSISGFGPDEWIVTTALGIEVIDLTTLAVVEFIPYSTVGGGMTYRGGDGQPTFMAAAGPLEPGFSVDEADQDFVTKCWEYKYATNRLPYWYSVSMPSFYPQYVPYGVFGPPAPQGFDLLNQYSVSLLANNDIAIHNDHGLLLHQFALPGPAIGGLVWDQDNKTCKIRTTGQMEVVINLASMPVTGLPVVSFVPFGSYTRWYPIVDRMNGWEFVIQRGGKRLWVFDHVNIAAVATIDLPARVIRQPVFDDQRKTLCMPLGDRRVAFFNAHNYRVGLPASQYLFYSPVLASNIAAAPVFDIYNHLAMLQLQDSRVVVLSNTTGALLWDSGVLPYQPVCPLQIDCYNNIAKGYYRDPAFNYYEMWVNLYPLVHGGSPFLQWIGMGTATPHGYPVFYSRGGYELSRLGTTTVQFRNLFDITIVTNLTTPRPMTGSLLLDRVNGYALVPLQGNALYYIDLYRQARGLPGAAHIVTIGGTTASTTDDIVFSTQTLQAVGRLSDGSIYLVDLRAGTFVNTPSFAGLQKVRRQLYTNPFRGLVDWKWWSGGPTGGIVTVDLVPTRGVPAQPPLVTTTSTTFPVPEACDTLPPPPPPPPTIDGPPEAPGHTYYRLAGLEPGATVFAYKPGALDFAPTYGTADEDGVCDDITVLAVAGEQVCFIAADPWGNASPPTCITVTTDVAAGAAGRTLSFALASGNPARSSAQFAVSLPASGAVRLGIYDVGGRLIRTILDGTLPAGDHTLTWNLRDEHGARHAGVYFARLTALGEQRSVRVIAIR